MNCQSTVSQLGVATRTPSLRGLLSFSSRPLRPVLLVAQRMKTPCQVVLVFSLLFSSLLFAAPLKKRRRCYRAPSRALRVVFEVPQRAQNNKNAHFNCKKRFATAKTRKSVHFHKLKSTQKCRFNMDRILSFASRNAALHRSTGLLSSAKHR